MPPNGTPGPRASTEGVRDRGAKPWEGPLGPSSSHTLTLIHTEPSHSPCPESFQEEGNEVDSQSSDLKISPLES